MTTLEILSSLRGWQKLESEKEDSERPKRVYSQEERIKVHEGGETERLCVTWKFLKGRGQT